MVASDGPGEYPVIAEARAGDDGLGITVTPGTVAYVTTGGLPFFSPEYDKNTDLICQLYGCLGNVCISDPFSLVISCVVCNTWEGQISY